MAQLDFSIRKNVAGSQSSDIKFLFTDSENPDDVVMADGINLVDPPEKPRLEGLGEFLDLDDDEVQAFTGYGNLVPALGMQEWDGHVFVSGATGSGKTFLINTMLMNDKKKRKVFLFTDHQKRDESLMPMYKSGRLKIVRDDPDDNKKWEVSVGDFLRDKKGAIAMFDDCTDEAALFMRDKALRHGRHHKMMVICVNHKMRDRDATKHALVNARFMIAFPSSNKGVVGAFMKDWMEMPPKARRAILRQAGRDGRQIVFHMQCPNAVATAKSVVRL